MAHLVPSLSFLRDLKSEIESGSSVATAINNATSVDENDFIRRIKIWWSLKQNGESNSELFTTYYQKSLIEVFNRGLEGAPILNHLEILDKEMTEEFDRQWKAWLESLPAKLSLPLLLCFFPSYIILLFGPLLMQFLKGVQ